MSTRATVGPPRRRRETPSRDHAQDTRDRILRLVVEAGPVTVVELAEHLGLTAAGVRRHVVALESDGLVVEHRGPRPAGRRGRPARTFVATERATTGTGPSSSGYADLAVEVLHHLDGGSGSPTVAEFAARRAGELADRHRVAVERAGSDPHARAQALAAGLADEGYAASVRPGPGHAVQLCQGRCPIRDVAAHFPQFCDAETKAFAELLGVHVQRLSTLAAGGHVCTTHVPTTSTTPALAPAPAPSDRPESGTGEGT